MINFLKISVLIIFFSTTAFAQNQEIALVSANNTIELNVTKADNTGDELRAKTDVKKYFSTKKPFWTGVTCGFIPVVGWVAAPIIAVTHKFDEKQMSNSSNKNNYLLDQSDEYRNAYKKFCIKKRAGNFVIGFGVGFVAIAGYFLATQPEYKK